MSNLKSIIEQVKEARRRMRLEGQEAMKNEFVKFFNAHPEAKVITWTQYTPYFNDGEPCEFGVNEWELKVHKEMMADDVREAIDKNGDSDDYDGVCATDILETIGGVCRYSWRNAEKSRDLTPDEIKLVEDYRKLASECCEEDDLLKEIFGDHVRVVATREGISVDETEHE